MNNCFASVEAIYNPELRDKPIAVCGSVEDRHGIVLAKSEEAKRFGIKTGDTVYLARQKCKDLIIVPPHYDRYVRYSELAKRIYSDYTDRIEPFGLDECWLDVTGSRLLFGSGEEIAEKIRERMKLELGLTVSVGVSFNKIFAKLGSDMKKPDAVTVISEENFKAKVWPKPVSDLLGIGRATEKRLLRIGIKTIGELAKTPPEILVREFGKNGQTLWVFASGLENSAVAEENYQPPIKSIGHGITCTRDLYRWEEVYKVMLYLSQDVSARLIDHNLKASSLQISVKTKDLSVREFQSPIGFLTNSEKLIADAAGEIFRKNFSFPQPVRAVTVRAINLKSSSLPFQTDLFFSYKKIETNERVTAAVDSLRRRFGREAVKAASVMGDIGVPISASSIRTLPGTVFGMQKNNC
jgi:DNA polymerase-4